MDIHEIEEQNSEQFLDSVSLETAPIFEDSLQEPHIPVFRQLFVALGLLVLVFGITYTGTIVALVKPHSNAEEVRVDAQLAHSEIPVLTQNAFDNTTLAAKSAIVWDVKEQRILFNKNGDDQLPLASVAKLMTALVAYELLNSTDTVKISAEAIRTNGDSGLMDGEKFSLQNLTDFTLISSSNDGATALSGAAGSATGIQDDPQKVFIQAMNLRAEELGLTQTYFKNATGLDLSTTEGGAYGSARDMAFLMEYIIEHYPTVLALTKIDETTVDNSNGEYHIAKNTNPVVNDIGGLIASKTGYTELAGGNLVVAFDVGLNHPVVISVLGSTQSGRFDDVLNLVERTRSYIKNSN